VTRWIEDARTALDERANPAWLVWAGERLMPTSFGIENDKREAAAREEAERAQRKEAEEQERARAEAERIRVAKEEDERGERERVEREKKAAHEELVNSYVEGRITVEEFEKGAAVLEGNTSNNNNSNSSNNDGDEGSRTEGETEKEDGGDDDVVLLETTTTTTKTTRTETDAAARGEKRKRNDDGGLRDVEGKVSIIYPVFLFLFLTRYTQCDRCKASGARPACIYGAEDAKCKKCADDRQGCYWGGVSRAGGTKKGKGVEEPRPVRAKRGVAKVKKGKLSFYIVRERANKSYRGARVRGGTTATTKQVDDADGGSVERKTTRENGDGAEGAGGAVGGGAVGEGARGVTGDDRERGVAGGEEG
jgi:hypothetical protein